MEIDKSHHSVRAMFSSIAGRYDLLNHLLSANQDKRWRRRAIRLLSPRRGECILDLCCGTGDLAFECLRQQPNCKVIGADFAIPMLEIANQKHNRLYNASGNVGSALSTQHSALRTSFLAGDALRLPFADATFDAAMVAFGARNFEKTDAGVREMQRVIKPGGRILILEFMRPTAPIIQRGFGFFFKNILPLIGRLISRHGSAYNYLPASVGEFYTRREFENLLKSTGFRKVRSFDYTGGIATSFIAHKTAGSLQKAEDS